MMANNKALGSRNLVLWPQVLRLSQEMLASARDDQWDKVAVLENERQGLIKQCFDCQLPLAEVTVVRDYIGQLMRSDQELVKLGAAKRDDIAVEINRQRHSRKACLAYQRCG